MNLSWQPCRKASSAPEPSAAVPGPEASSVPATVIAVLLLNGSKLWPFTQADQVT